MLSLLLAVCLLWQTILLTTAQTHWTNVFTQNDMEADGGSILKLKGDKEQWMSTPFHRLRVRLGSATVRFKQVNAGQEVEDAEPMVKNDFDVNGDFWFTVATNLSLIKVDENSFKFEEYKDEAKITDIQQPLQFQYPIVYGPKGNPAMYTAVLFDRDAIKSESGKKQFKIVWLKKNLKFSTDFSETRTWCSNDEPGVPDFLNELKIEAGNPSTDPGFFDNSKKDAVHRFVFTIFRHTKDLKDSSASAALSDSGYLTFYDAGKPIKWASAAVGLIPYAINFFKIKKVKATIVAQVLVEYIEAVKKFNANLNQIDVNQLSADWKDRKIEAAGQVGLDTKLATIATIPAQIATMRDSLGKLQKEDLVKLKSWKGISEIDRRNRLNVPEGILNKKLADLEAINVDFKASNNKYVQEEFNQRLTKLKADVVEASKSLDVQNKVASSRDRYFDEVEGKVNEVDASLAALKNDLANVDPKIQGTEQEKKAIKDAIKTGDIEKSIADLKDNLKTAKDLKPFEDKLLDAVDLMNDVQKSIDAAKMQDDSEMRRDALVEAQTSAKDIKAKEKDQEFQKLIATLKGTDASKRRTELTPKLKDLVDKEEKMSKDLTESLAVVNQVIPLIKKYNEEILTAVDTAKSTTVEDAKNKEVAEREGALTAAKSAVESVNTKVKALETSIAAVKNPKGKDKADLDKLKAGIADPVKKDIGKMTRDIQVWTDLLPAEKKIADLAKLIDDETKKVDEAAAKGTSSKTEAKDGLKGLETEITKMRSDAKVQTKISEKDRDDEEKTKIADVERAKADVDAKLAELNSKWKNAYNQAVADESDEILTKAMTALKAAEDSYNIAREKGDDTALQAAQKAVTDGGVDKAGVAQKAKAVETNLKAFKNPELQKNVIDGLKLRNDELKAKGAEIDAVSKTVAQLVKVLKELADPLKKTDIEKAKTDTTAALAAEVDKREDLLKAALTTGTTVKGKLEQLEKGLRDIKPTPADQDKITATLTEMDQLKKDNSKRMSDAQVYLDLLPAEKAMASDKIKKDGITKQKEAIKTAADKNAVKSIKDALPAIKTEIDGIPKIETKVTPLDSDQNKKLQDVKAARTQIDTDFKALSDEVNAKYDGYLKTEVDTKFKEVKGKLDAITIDATPMKADEKAKKVEEVKKLETEVNAVKTLVDGNLKEATSQQTKTDLASFSTQIDTAYKDKLDKANNIPVSP